jgi:putative sterol carrier protein
MTLKSAADDWYAVSSGKMNAMQAFMSGKIKIEGDMGMAMKLQTMFAQ